VFLATTNVRLAFDSTRLYTYGFARHNVSEYSGIEKPELERVARAFVSYFNSRARDLNVTAVVTGEEVPLLQEREVLHMRDVKDLVRKVFRLQEVSAGFLLVFGLIGYAIKGKAFARTLGRGLIWGGGLTVALVLALALGSTLDFEGLFVRFHLLGFSNDLWQLDPDVYILTRLFPEGFWLDATLLVAGATLVEALLLLGLGFLLRGRTIREEAPETLLRV
ncbi:MAG: TIGR01906 family membrane protein, partial [Chloroflexi bacterium]|nr:TIGR01906 family membrane protein [Chloroflexota bacterium]